MLPSQELFRTIPCPYYIAGLCERPHCFFRHTKSDILLARKIERGLLEDGTLSDENDEQDSPSKNNNGPKDSYRTDLTNKISAASKHSTISTNLVGVKPDLLPQLPNDEVRKRPANEVLESRNKKIRLSVGSNCKEVDKTQESQQKKRNHNDGASPDAKHSKENNQVKQDKTLSCKKDCGLKGSLDIICLDGLASNSESQVLSKSENSEDKDKSKRESSSRKRSSHSESKDPHGKKSSSSSSSKHRSSSKDKNGHRSSSSRSSTSSSRSSNSKERSHKTSSSSSSSSSKSRSSSSKKDSNSSHSSKTSKDYKKESYSKGQESKKSPKLASPPTSSNNTKKTDSNKPEIDTEMTDDKMIFHDPGSPIEFRYPEISDYEDDDPDEIALECLRMFEEYKPEEQKKDEKGCNENASKSSLSAKFEESPSSLNSSSPTKRRVAHPGAVNHPPALQSKPQPQRSSQDLMKTLGSRLESQRKLGSDETCVPNSSYIYTSGAGNKKRIAHVSNVSGLLRAPAVKTPPTNVGTPSRVTDASSNKPISTTAQTASKGQARKAHLPSTTAKLSKRPLIVVDSPVKISKIPNAHRQKVLDQLFDTLIKIHGENPQIAFSQAISEEQAIVGRCQAKPVYLSLSVSAITRLRREAQNLSTIPPGSNSHREQSIMANKVVSHDHNLNGGLADNCSVIKQTKHKFPEKQELYKALIRYRLTETEMINNGFPRPHPSGDKARAVAKSFYSTESYVYEPRRRTCERCKKVYAVNLDGTELGQSTCTHHSGRKKQERVGRTRVVTYTCCGAESGSGGCITTNFHVPKSLQTSKIRGFVSCVQDEGPDETMGLGDWDVVAIDCEMVNTTAGSELARATFVGKNNEILYDKLVKPDHPVVDYNTPFSGLTENDFVGVETRLGDVQAAMLTELKPNSILIGHSLENDLLSLRFKHEYVIDTSVLFPHRSGPPSKRALRNLTSEYLSKIIQNSEAGHDSAEDARAALNLVYYKLSEDIKLTESTSNGNGS